jgi:hypothetical protein
MQNKIKRNANEIVTALLMSVSEIVVILGLKFTVRSNALCMIIQLRLQEKRKTYRFTVMKQKYSFIYFCVLSIFNRQLINFMFHFSYFIGYNYRLQL